MLWTTVKKNDLGMLNKPAQKAYGLLKDHIDETNMCLAIQKAGALLKSAVKDRKTSNEDIILYSMQLFIPFMGKQTDSNPFMKHAMLVNHQFKHWNSHALLFN